MALRQHCLIGLTICLLLAVAVAAVGPSPAPRASTVLASEECYETVMGVPSWCAGQFIRALFDGSNRADSPISFYCCRLLACVRQWSCYFVLRGVCPPPETNQCWAAVGRTRVDDRHRH
ncbi:hypothetical protein ZWY2020_026543 [Hordeum vulgare]|nr:hypothetical protein ZWY2020_026543 [Hordeum vulgare]